MNLLKTINAIAHKLNDSNLKKATNNFSNTVFIGDNNIYKITTSKYKIEKKDYLKEEQIFSILNEKMNNRWLNIIPSMVYNKFLDKNTYLQVHTKLKGTHPKKLTNELIITLANFLSDLHNINHFKEITEFEDKGSLPFSEYINFYSKKYYNKLKEHVNSDDLKLIIEAMNQIGKIVKHSLPNSLDLVLVHKDIYIENLLVLDGKLSGVIDWDASQVAPKEWELAIILQRIPQFWDLFLENYSHKYNFQVIKLCGLVQSLRFWKSFPTQTSFVDEQKQFIKKLLKNYV